MEDYSKVYGLGITHSLEYIKVYKEIFMCSYMSEEMTPENAVRDLRELFAKAGKPDKKYRTEEEQLDYLSRDGAARFARKALGIWKGRTVKKLDEIAQLLIETGIVLDMEKARQTVPKIVEANKLHSHAINRRKLCTYLNFKEVKGPSQDVMYRITAWAAD